MQNSSTELDMGGEDKKVIHHSSTWCFQMTSYVRVNPRKKLFISLNTQFENFPVNIYDHSCGPWLNNFSDNFPLSHSVKFYLIQCSPITINTYGRMTLFDKFLNSIFMRSSCGIQGRFHYGVLPIKVRRCRLPTLVFSVIHRILWHSFDLRIKRLDEKLAASLALSL